MQADPQVSLSPEELVSRVAKESWELFKEHAVTLILAWLLTALVTGLTLGLASGTLAVGYILLVKKLRRGEPGTVGDAMHFGHFVGGLLATLLVGVGVTVGMLLLVIPGLLLAVMWTFTYHAMAYEDLGAVSAMKASWGLARDNFLHVLVLLIAFTVLNAIAGAVMFATLVSVPLTLIAMTVAFEVLTGQVPQAALPEQAGPAGTGEGSPIG